jgi:DNA-directed RNA polymerase subunit beta'
LRGLKENVIVGRLIPAGTGLAHHDKRRRKHDELSTEELDVLGGATRGGRSEDFADSMP